MIARTSENLEYDPVSSRERLVAGLVACAFVVVVGFDIPYATTPLAIVGWVTPTVQAIAFCAFALTAWMLVAQYRVSGYAPFAILGCAFAIAAAFRVATFVLDPTTFPGTGWLGASVQSAAFLRVFSRVGFALVVAAYALADWRERHVPGSARARVVPIWIGAVVLFALGLSIATVGQTRLPTLIDSDSHFSSLYQRVVVPIALACYVGVGAPCSCSSRSIAVRDCGSGCSSIS